MALYESGVASSMSDLVSTRLKAFATTNGWTLNDDNWPTHLHLSKGLCNISMVAWEFSGTDAYSSPINDDRIRWSLTDGYTAGGYLVQTDTILTASTSTGHKCNDLRDGGAQYWFFTNATGDYIYMVVESSIAAGHYTHFGFGLIDKTGLTYTGGAFGYSHYFQYYPTSTNTAIRYDDNFAGTPHTFPWLGTPTSSLMLYVGDAAPTNMISGGDMFPLMDRKNAIEQISNTRTYLDSRLALDPSSFNGVTSFAAVLLIGEQPADDKLHYYFGQLTGLRFCSMTNRAAEETLVIGSDTWHLFPFRRKADTIRLDVADLPTSPTVLNVSGNYGYAIRQN